MLADASRELGAGAGRPRAKGVLRFPPAPSRELGATVDTHELGDLTCRLVCRFLGADAVELQTAESTYRHVERHTIEDRGPEGFLPLSTAIGRVGALRWWRSHPLGEAEEQGLAVIAGRAAIGIEHAILMDSTEASALRDPLTG